MEDEDATESTRAHTIFRSNESRQGMTNYYVNELLGRLMEHPYESVPELLQYLQRGGPCPEEENLLRLFGGRPIFIHTCRRMNIVRRAVLQGWIDQLPIGLNAWGGNMNRAGETMEVASIDWWTPHLDEQNLFRHQIPNMEEEIQRYPSYIDTEEYLATPSDEQSVDTVTSDSSSHGWIQMLMPQDWYYEPDPEQNLPTDYDMDISTETTTDVEMD